jgi:putative transposase
VSFIDEHRDRRVADGLRWGVEPICQVLSGHGLQITSATYYAAKTRAPSARAVRDGELKPIIATVHEANYGVCGVRKMHAALRRDGVQIGRDQTGRLMRELGLAGVRRGRFKRTTIRDDAAARPADLVHRDFHAQRPDQLWVCDLTYIRTWVGFAYLALVIDVFSRRIVGWALAGHLGTELPLEALELAVWTRQQQRLNGLIHHTDAGSQGGFNWSSQHLEQEVVRWVTDRSRSRFVLTEARSRRRDGRRWPGARIGSGSGRRSLAA